jgi:hypothetical protein
VSRRARIALAVAIAVCLVGAGAALRWRAIDEREGAKASRHDRTVAMVLASTSRSIQVAARQSASADELVVKTTTERDALNALVASLQAEIDHVRADRDANAIAALASGVRAGVVTQCLRGVQQALNQLSVGDRGGITSLRKVDGACREAAA